MRARGALCCQAIPQKLDVCLMTIWLSLSQTCVRTVIKEKKLGEGSEAGLLLCFMGNNKTVVIESVFMCK